MQSEHIAPSAGGGLQAVAVSATDAPMTPGVATMREIDTDAAERWRAWGARGANNDREMARTMKRVFVVIAVVLSAWLVVQLLA